MLQLHYLSPARHLFKSQLKVLESLVNSLETEKRCRAKRNQHPLTYPEAYALLTQILGGDDLPTYTGMYSHLPPWKTDSSVMIAREATVGAVAIMAVEIMTIRVVEANEGNLPVEEERRPTGTMRGRTTQSGHIAETSILPVAALPPTVLRSTVVVRDSLEA